VDGERSVVRRRTRSQHDVARRVSFNARQPSVERHHGDGRHEGTQWRRTASGSPRGRRRSCHDATRASSTRSMNVDHLARQHATSVEHLRRVSMAVRQLTDAGKCAQLFPLLFIIVA